uniref:Uncharacterized protein n=1 Tax=Anopheles atroparvus TaxID=41427 RepID=A0A182IKN7_ANOAO
MSPRFQQTFGSRLPNPGPYAKRIKAYGKNGLPYEARVMRRRLPTATGSFPVAFVVHASNSASVVVHVINGEQPAAMQHGNSSANSILINNRSFSRRGRHLRRGVLDLGWLGHVGGSKNLILSLTSSWFCWLLKSIGPLGGYGR